MNTTIERRRAALINVAYYSLIIGAFYLFMRFAFWTVAPFLFAFFLAMLLQKPVHSVVRRTPLKKGFVSFLAVLFIALFAAGLLALAGTSIVSEVKGLVASMTETFKNIPEFITQAESWLLRAITPLPDAIETTLAGTVTDLADSLLAAMSEQADSTAPSPFPNFDLSFLKTPITGVINTATKVPSFLISVVIFFIASCFMTADYNRITGFIKRQLPEKKREALSKTKKLTLTTLGKMIKAYCLIICITCTELLIGLSVLDLLGFYNGGYKFLIALCIAIVDILPVLGSGTVLIPWGIISLFMGDIGRGIGLLVIYVIITVLRQYIEPKLVAGQLGLPPIATLIGMYLGLKIFGVMGMFILPLTITILKVLNDDGVIHLWRTSRSKPEGASSVELKIPKLHTKTKGRK